MAGSQPPQEAFWPYLYRLLRQAPIRTSQATACHTRRSATRPLCRTPHSLQVSSASPHNSSQGRNGQTKFSAPTREESWNGESNRRDASTERTSRSSALG